MASTSQLPGQCLGLGRPPSVPIGFVPQKLGLIWWVPWECKNLGELNFHMENGLPEAQKLPNRYYHISRSQGNLSEFFFVHYWGCGRHFSGGDRSDLLKRGYCSICGSVSFFVRGVIWHWAERYNCNIMSQILSFLTHLTSLPVGSISSSHSKISAICWCHFLV